MDVPNPMLFSHAVCSATGSSMVTTLVLLTSPKMQYGYSTKKDFVTTLWNGWNSQNNFIFYRQAGVKDVQMKLEWAELYALSEWVLIARDLNLGNEFDGLIKQILKARVQLINRSCNKVVDALCNFLLLYSYFLRFGMNYLSCIHNLVILDSS
ncbi:hypothetical protein Gorai_019450 [Gossypium raimondii]|uniref:Uncharacterized protein n=1 Tax=Gossypium raimondii TaxID=29730 RepID=A0A7J8PNJ5_GOSRA|nr:hypothetical protein [Gossypium raimondii]